MTVKALKEALKEKVAAGELGTNIDETAKGKARVYDDPPGHKRNTTGGNVGFSTGAVAAAKDTREDMMERLFDSPKTTAPAEQDLIKELFNKETVTEGHMPHSILQRRGREKTASAETLTDQVRRITGRR